MPKAKGKPTPVKPVAPVPAPPRAPTPEEIKDAVKAHKDALLRAQHNKNSPPVVYDHMEIVEYSTTSAKGPLTVEDMKTSIGWETEKEFQARKVAEEHAKGNMNAKPENFLLGDGSYREPDGTMIPVHCKNIAGEKVVCRYNAHNRPFDMDWCEHIIHTHLHGQWAGPHTIPGETVNGETVRISRYGRYVSGQHTVTGAILADEVLQKARAELGRAAADAKYPTWAKEDHIFLETIVITGISEDPRVLMTVDYVKPRTAADMFYTSELYKDSNVTDRKEMCKVLDSAIATLWTRTDTRGYRTHPETMAFLGRHQKILDCVAFIFRENDWRVGRKISKLRLQPGVCAALMYLQASSGPGTDGDVYRNEEPPSEANLDWSLWDRAEEFWTLLTSGRDFQPVRTALGRLVESDVDSKENLGMGGRGPEKLALLAKAWERWRNHRGSAPPFDLSDLEKGGILCLNYSDLDDKGNRLPDGQIKLLDNADFGGIDSPILVGKGKVSKGPPDPPAPTREEIEAATEAARNRRR